jgi:cell division transport system ATP-binding protein
MIEFQNVSKCYTNGHTALDNLTFELKKGEFAFLTGHSGAGKSTLLKLIAAIESPNHGKITVAGSHIQSLKHRHLPYLRRQIGMIFQSPNLLMDRTVFDNIALPLIIAEYSYKEIQSRVRAVLAKVCLHNKAKQFPDELSSGEQQRVAIARAIVTKPPILLADEPTGNLDPELAAEIMHLFEQFNNLGMTVLIASHDVALIERLKRRVITLSEGRLVHA